MDETNYTKKPDDTSLLTNNGETQAEAPETRDAKPKRTPSSQPEVVFDKA